MAPSLGRHDSLNRDLRKVDPRTPTQDSGDSQPAELRTLDRLHMAGQEGFEPPTPGFGVRCSAVRATGLFSLEGGCRPPSTGVGKAHPRFARTSPLLPPLRG